MPTTEDDHNMLAPVQFQVLENRDPDGRLRVALIGELDLAVADQLAVRFEQLSNDGIPVLLDLSGLDFIDSRGIRTLIRAVQDGCANGQTRLEVGQEITRSVQSTIDLLGVAAMLWPTGRSLERAGV